MKIDLRLGDCLEVMKSIPDGSIDLILCDLPYGSTQCRWDVVIEFGSLWLNYKRIIKPCGGIVLTASQPFTSSLIISNKEWFRYCWVWDKRFGSNRALVKYQPMKVHEDIVVFGDPSPNYYPQMILRDRPIRVGSNKCLSLTSPISNAKSEYNNKEYTHKFPESIITFPVRSEESFHPTQKPVALMQYLIKTYSNEGDTVLDNCMGSGTTGVACHRTNRNFIGIEKEPEYFSIAQKRLKEAEYQAAIFTTDWS